MKAQDMNEHLSPDERRIRDARGDGFHHPYTHAELKAQATSLGITVDDMKQRLILTVRDSGQMYGCYNGNYKPLSNTFSEAQFFNDFAPYIPTLVSPPEPRKDGSPGLTSFKNILKDYSATINSVNYSYDLEKPRLDLLKGNLVIPAGLPSRYDDINAVYNPNVHRWLTLLVDQEGIDWATLALDRKTMLPGLCLCGPAGTGKTVFAQALQEFWGISVSDGDATDTFNSQLLKSPLIYMDEGATTHAGGNATQTFNKLKSLITQKTARINTKGKQHVMLDGFLRMLITLNNAAGLFGGMKNKNQYDVDAIVRRLQFRQVRMEAQACLQKLFTDHGDETISVIIPGHIKWLNEHCREEARARVAKWDLMNNPELRRAIQQTDNTVTVMAGLQVKAIMDGLDKDPSVFLITEDDFYIKATAFGDKAKERFDPDGLLLKVSAQDRREALRALSKDGETVRVKVETERARYWRVDLDALADLSALGVTGEDLREQLGIIKRLHEKQESNRNMPHTPTSYN